MKWQYAITREKVTDDTHYYAIREVYESEPDDLDGENSSWTIHPIAASSDTADGVIKDLEMMLRDARDSKIFDIDTEQWIEEAV